MKESGVYMVLNVVTNERYVGSTSAPFSRRWTEHRSLLHRNRHGNKPLQAAYDTYGLAVFRFVILEPCSAEARIEREQYWMDLFRADGLVLYNRCPRAGDNTGLVFTHHKERPVLRPHVKDWTLRSPSGEILHIHNLKAFSREHGLDNTALWAVANGRRRTHKGYTNVNDPAPAPVAPKPPKSRVCPACGGPKRPESALCRACYLASDKFHEQLRANAAAANRAANVARWGTAHLAKRGESDPHESP
jgi:hypothetical protein